MTIHPTETGYSSGTLPIYYELRRADSDRAPLLLVHGGGSTIASSWRALMPLLTDRTLVAVELQGHGHTAAGDRPPSFEASADDVATLLGDLALGPIDVLGFSNGGQVAMQLAARRPDLIHRLIVASAPYRRDGMIDGFWPALEGGTFEHMPPVFVEADLAACVDPSHAQAMYETDRALMLGFADWPDALPASIAAPALVVGGDHDVVSVTHLARLATLIPGARLLIVPANHGSYLGEVASCGGDPRELQRTLPLLTGFLDE